jgi:NADH-quinone oxidoreductase subunit K
MIGCFGLFLNRKNMILILMCIVLAANINFVSASVFLNDINGQVFSIFILTIAAAEAAIGLAILVIYFRNKGEIDVTKINQLKD